MGTLHLLLWTLLLWLAYHGTASNTHSHEKLQDTIESPDRTSTPAMGEEHTRRRVDVHFEQSVTNNSILGIAVEANKDRTGWTESARDSTSTTYSVIVVANNPHPSNQFRDKRRVQAYAPGGHNVVSVQYTSPSAARAFDRRSPGAFFVRHPEGVDKCVRLVFIADIEKEKENEVS